jgi:predicted PolB exonuclease-like 3'-5' exonuclease
MFSPVLDKGPLMNVLVFDIETIPDIDGCRRIYDLHGLSDDDVARAVFQLRRQQSGTEFLRHYLHRVVAISAVLRTRDQFKVWSLGDIESDEQDLLQRFLAASNAIPRGWFRGTAAVSIYR